MSFHYAFKDEITRSCQAAFENFQLNRKKLHGSSQNHVKPTRGVRYSPRDVKEPFYINSFGLWHLLYTTTKMI